MLRKYLNFFRIISVRNAQKCLESILYCAKKVWSHVFTWSFVFSRKKNGFQLTGNSLFTLYEFIDEMRCVEHCGHFVFIMYIRLLYQEIYVFFSCYAFIHYSVLDRLVSKQLKFTNIWHFMPMSFAIETDFRT